jgi:hypothetical protein
VCKCACARTLFRPVSSLVLPYYYGAVPYRYRTVACSMLFGSVPFSFSRFGTRFYTDFVVYSLSFFTIVPVFHTYIYILFLFYLFIYFSLCIAMGGPGIQTMVSWLLERDGETHSGIHSLYGYFHCTFTRVDAYGTVDCTVRIVSHGSFWNI